MHSHKYFIKGMVCERCIRIVKEIAEDSGVQATEINLGEIVLEASLEEIDEIKLHAKLKSFGFILLKDKKTQQVQQIKKLVAEVYSGNFDFPNSFRFSELAVDRIGKNYESISKLFSRSEGLTLEKFIIQYRIQKIKELLVYTDNSLSHISIVLGFSSVAHLSRQFKTQTGFNPSYFRIERAKKETTKEAFSKA